MTDALNLTEHVRGVVALMLPGATMEDRPHGNWCEAVDPVFPVAISFSKGYHTRGKISVAASLPSELRNKMAGSSAASFLYVAGQYPKRFERNITPERFTTQTERVAQELRDHVYEPAKMRAVEIVSAAAFRQDTVNETRDIAETLARTIGGRFSMYGSEPHVYTNGVTAIDIRFYEGGGGRLKFSGTSEELATVAKAIHAALKSKAPAGP